MNSATPEQKIKTLRKQLALGRRLCSSLAREFKSPTLDCDQKAEIARRLDKAFKECRALELAIDFIESHDRNPRVSLA
ncbi:MAG TPA: hypothetical protein VMT38_04395 [Terracidiphilus sp.]|nr:hypothetical protein [Terracidiphilus sp.]